MFYFTTIVVDQASHRTKSEVLSMFGWFRRRTPASPFPADMLDRLDRLGRCKIDMMNSGIDWPEVVTNCIAAFHEQADADPDRFLSDLQHTIERDSGGFATYGAASLMYELVPESIRSEAGVRLVDLAIKFKRQRGLPISSFNGYELQRWYETRRT
jgi:hypothetical protein